MHETQRETVQRSCTTSRVQAREHTKGVSPDKPRAPALETRSANFQETKFLLLSQDENLPPEIAVLSDCHGVLPERPRGTSSLEPPG